MNQSLPDPPVTIRTVTANRPARIWLWAASAVASVLLLAAAVAGYRLHHGGISPWMGTAMPHATFAADGLHISGTERIRNFGTGPVLRGDWAYYVLAVPAARQNLVGTNIYNRATAVRMEASDREAVFHDFGSLASHATRDLTFTANDPQQIGAASYLENGTSPGPVNHYLRFLLTYSDRTGKLHHTDRCYQVVKGVNG